MTDDEIRERLANELERQARDRAPVDTGLIQHGKPLGIPPWLRELLHRAGWDPPYVEMVEVGGRGVKHPHLGWITTDELRELASNRTNSEDD